MKKYEVHFGMMLMSGFNVEVEASSKEEAEAKAQEMIEAGELDDVMEEARREADEDINIIEEDTEEIKF